MQSDSKPATHERRVLSLSLSLYRDAALRITSPPTVERAGLALPPAFCRIPVDKMPYVTTHEPLEISTRSKTRNNGVVNTSFEGINSRPAVTLLPSSSSSSIRKITFTTSGSTCTCYEFVTNPSNFQLFFFEARDSRWMDPRFGRKIQTGYKYANFFFFLFF